MNQCLERARQGDPAALRIVIDTLRPRMERMAAYYARCSQQDADDLLQEAWIGLLEALHEVDIRIGVPEQYLIRNARWRLLDALKRARVRHSHPLDEEAVLADSHAEEAIARADLLAFLPRLTATQQDVLTCLLAGLTWREAGDRLGCSSANIAYHVRQIKRQYEVWQHEPAVAEQSCTVL